MEIGKNDYSYLSWNCIDCRRVPKIRARVFVLAKFNESSCNVNEEVFVYSTSKVRIRNEHQVEFRLTYLFGIVNK